MLLKWRHAGQACITANRVYIQKGSYDKFAKLLTERTKQLVVGHGNDKTTTMGPVTTPRGLDKCEAQVEDAIKKNGHILLGGKRKDQPGYFFEPTIIGNAKKEMLITEEETFAPVLALYQFESEDEVVELANDTSVCCLRLDGHRSC
jgi:succinate-semialdehyde dehydrogenase/glutarate-semialdehyde dehydrogenase